MEVRWSPEAADDLAAIVSYIQAGDPAAAQRTAMDIYERTGAFTTFPKRGRQGRVKDRRELPLPPLLFVIVYKYLPMRSKSPTSSTALDAGRGRRGRSANNYAVAMRRFLTLGKAVKCKRNWPHYVYPYC